MSEFDLRAVVRETLSSSPAADPAALAEHVLDRIAVEDYGQALRQTLRTYIREAIGQQRMSAPVPTPRVNASWKVEAIRASWKRALANRMCVADGEWKTLADCTAQDLLFVAKERRVAAAKNLATAETYESLAQLMESQGAAVVADLAEVTLETALCGAA